MAEVKSMPTPFRTISLAVSALAVVAACATAQEVPSPARPGVAAHPAAEPVAGHQLYLKTAYANDVYVFDTQSQGVHHLPAGIMSSDGKLLLTIATGEAGKNVLAGIDPATGRKLGEQGFEGAFQFPSVSNNGAAGGLSPKGRWAALFRGDTDSSRRIVKSSYLVFDTTFKSPPRLIQLNGTYLFDGIADSGRYLYVNEYYDNSSNYKVRAYDLGTGRLSAGTVVDKSNPKETTMAGSRVASVSSPDGRWLYSLYANAGSAPFIHALNLENVFAFCVDLERPIGADPNLYALTLGGSGRLYAATGEKGWVAEIETGEIPKIVRRANFDPRLRATSGWFVTQAEAKELRTGAAAASGDGKTLFVAGDSGVVSFDTATLRPRARYAQGEGIRSLAMSPDGSWLFAVSVGTYGGPASLLRIDASTGSTTRLGQLPDTFVQLVRVEPKAA
jgi:hypothetical protein